MHNPKDSLQRTPGLAGKGCRYVDKTSAVRKIRLDRDSDASLKFASVQLSSSINPKDRVSLSLIMRRCLCLYREYLLERLSEPGSMDREREQVRKTSRMPTKWNRPRVRKPCNTAKRRTVSHVS